MLPAGPFSANQPFIILIEFFNDRTLMWVGCILYGLAFAFALASILRERQQYRPIMTTLLIGGFVFQSVGLYLRGVMDQALPLANPFEIFQVLSWSAVGLNLILRQLFKLRLLNFFASGFAFALGMVSLLSPSWDHPATGSALGGSPWVGFHAALAIVSYGVFGILAITSLMYLIQHHGLSRHRSGGLFNLLPSIRQLEEINSRLIVLGVSILSASIVIGFLNWTTQSGKVGLTKLLIASIIWVAYMVILYLRKHNHLVATPFARACVILFLCALFTLWPLTAKGSEGQGSSGSPNDPSQHEHGKR